MSGLNLNIPAEHFPAALLAIHFAGKGIWLRRGGDGGPALTGNFGPAHLILVSAHGEALRAFLDWWEAYYTTNRAKIEASGLQGFWGNEGGEK